MSVGRKLRAESAAPFLKVSQRAGGDGGHVLCRDGDRDVKRLMRHLRHRTRSTRGRVTSGLLPPQRASL